MSLFRIIKAKTVFNELLVPQFIKETWTLLLWREGIGKVSCKKNK